MKIKTPDLYARRILLAVTGLSPQLVTETPYAVAVAGEKSFRPSEIHLITTAEGAERARLTLLHARLIEQQERERRRAEEVREAERWAVEEAQREEDRIAAMSPLEKELCNIAAENKGKKGYVSWLKALEDGRWGGKQARAVAGIMRKYMQKDKQWRERSAKKRPQKDKPYQLTLRVKKFLVDENG